MEERIEQFLQEKQKELKQMRWGELERRYNEVSSETNVMDENRMRAEYYMCMKLMLVYVREMKDRLEEAIEKWG